MSSTKEATRAILAQRSRTGLAVVLGAVTAAAISCSGEPEPPVAPLRTPLFLPTVSAQLPTMVPPAPTRAPTPSPIPTPAPLTFEDLPVPEWTLVDGNALKGRAEIGQEIGQQFFLDVETERLYALPPPGTLAPGGDFKRVRLLAWAPSGELLLIASAQRQNQVLSAVYRGRPGQPFRLVDVEAPQEASYSPDGALLALSYSYAPHIAVDIVDAASFTTIDSIQWGGIGSAGWSRDGEYVAIDLPAPPPQYRAALLWRRTDRGRISLPGTAIAWSSTGHRLTYTTEPLNPSTRAGWILDPDSGATLKYVSGENAGYWSPGDQYMTTSKFDGQYVAFTIYRLADGERMATVTGAWFMGWLDDSSVYFIGNICSTFDLFFVRADGSELTRFPKDSTYVLDVYPSPDKRWLAYGTQKGPQPFIRLYDIRGASVHDIPNVAGLDLVGLDRSRDIWSPDGRYLRLEGPFGRDGPCYPYPTPQTTTIE